MIRFHCPACQAALSAPDEKAGFSVQCRQCRTWITIPKPFIAAAPVPPPPPIPASPQLPPSPAIPRPLAGAEQILYQSGPIVISTTRAVFGANTFPINGMTSVRAGIVSPDRTMPILLLVFGTLMLTCCGCGFVKSVTDTKSTDNGGFSGVSLLMTLVSIFIAVGGILWLVLDRDKPAVMICTAAGELPAYKSSDKAEIDAIVAALNQAFVQRG
jgi:hypothetical protein